MSDASSPRSRLAGLQLGPELIFAWVVIIFVVAWVVTTAPPLARGDPSQVYLPFARFFSSGRFSEAYPVLTSFGRMPLFPHVLGVASLIGGIESQLLTGVVGLAYLAGLYVGCRLLDRVGLGREQWIWLILVGTSPVMLKTTVLCLPDSLVFFLSLAFLHTLFATSVTQPTRIKRAALWASACVLTRFNPFAFPLLSTTSTRFRIRSSCPPGRGG